jgi:hypothetical protein
MTQYPRRLGNCAEKAPSRPDCGGLDRRCRWGIGRTGVRQPTPGGTHWAPDGRVLLLNGDGLLWRLNLWPEAELQRVPIDDLPPINDDHVLDAERGLIYLSANDCHICVAPIEGGTARRITHDSGHYHFLHGVSPDGATLAFVELPRGDLAAPGRLALISSAGGETHYPEAGSSHLDGPDGLGCISTPRSSPDAPLTRNWLGYPPRAAALNVSWSPRRATGSRICR